MKDKLFGIILEADKMCRHSAACRECVGYDHLDDCLCYLIADHLSASGVIIPICKIGDKLYEVLEDDEEGAFIEELTVTEVGTKAVFYSSYYPPQDDIRSYVLIKEIGKTVFLSREEAEQAIEKRS